MCSPFAPTVSVFGPLHVPAGVAAAALAVPYGDGLSASLRREHTPEMLACLYDPFCIKLAAGTLPKSAFDTFVVQVRGGMEPV